MYSMTFSKALSPPPSPNPRYEHAHFETRRRFLRFLIARIGFTLLAKLDRVEGLENVPTHGPAIVMINHIAFVDPIAVIHVLPRNIIPMAKEEVFGYPLIGIFPRVWRVIPVRREEVDRQALHQALDILKAGEIVLVAPEGTRHNNLQDAKEGVAYLASRSGVPVVPTAIDGSIGFPCLRTNSRWREPGIVIRFGRPFQYQRALGRPNRAQLRQMTDEAMYVLAALLPEHRRGAYADLPKATQETIAWA
jgi:1-acyl-sn-glycerol-3-phosphate acyltransferase